MRASHHFESFLTCSITSGIKKQAWLYVVNVASHLGHKFKTKKENKKRITKQREIKIFTTWTWKKRASTSLVNVWEHLWLNLQETVKTLRSKQSQWKQEKFSVWCVQGQQITNSPAAAVHAHMCSYSRRPDSSGFEKLRPDFTHSSLLIFNEDFFFNFYRQKHTDEAEGRREAAVTSRRHEICPLKGTWKRLK